MKTQLLQQTGNMQASTYNRTLVNDSLAYVTEPSGGSTSQTQLAVAAGNKVVAKSGEKVFLFTKYSNLLYELTLTADLGRTTTCSFSSIDFADIVEAGSVILMRQEPKFDKINNTDLYFQQSLYLTTGTNGNDYLSAFGTSSFTVNSGAQLADGNSKPNRWSSQFGIFVAPYACSIKKIKGWSSSDAGTGDNAVVSVWYASPNAGTTTNITIELLKSFTLTSQNNQNHIFDIEDNPASGYPLAEGDFVFVSIKRTGTKSSGVEWYADIGFCVEMFKQPI